MPGQLAGPSLHSGHLAGPAAALREPAGRGPAEARLSRRWGARAGRRHRVVPRSPPSPGLTWLRGQPEVSPGASLWERAVRRLAVPAGLWRGAAHPRCSRLAPAGAGVLAASPGARPPGLARCRGRHACAAGRTLTAPAVLGAWLPVLVLYPAHAVREAQRRCHLPLPTPWLCARRREHCLTEEHRTVSFSTQTGQLMTNKTCRY